jgi:hypothetical protein
MCSLFPLSFFFSLSLGISSGDYVYVKLKASLDVLNYIHVCTTKGKNRSYGFFFSYLKHLKANIKTFSNSNTNHF